MDRSLVCFAAALCAFPRNRICGATSSAVIGGKLRNDT
jgi:hypothetical protein